MEQQIEFEYKNFNNEAEFQLAWKEQEGKRYSVDNAKLFFESIPEILAAWQEYLLRYCDKSRELFGKYEFPWERFDEPTWVSSLAVAIAKKYPDAMVIEELPVTKGKNESQKGNADLWCSLENRLNFYLEAKTSPWAKNHLKGAKPYSFQSIGAKLTSEKNSLISRAFRDYQKSAGKNYISSKSPHSDEAGRNHPHLFLSLVIRPVSWDEKDEWGAISFTTIFKEKDIQIFPDKSDVDKNRTRNLHRIPMAGFILREKNILRKDKKIFGCIALVMMMGESDQKGRKPTSN